MEQEHEPEPDCTKSTWESVKKASSSYLVLLVPKRRGIIVAKLEQYKDMSLSYHTHQSLTLGMYVPTVANQYYSILKEKKI